MYSPQPIDTSGVTIPEVLDGLLHTLAENAHETWAKKRQDEGWVYGPKRNDELKQHPCLVAYDELPKSEQEYDQVLTSETIRVILSLGYRIVRDQGLSAEL